MQNIKLGCILVRQAIQIDNIKTKLWRFVKDNKFCLVIGGISITLLSIYTVLIINFINLIKIIY